MTTRLARNEPVAYAHRLRRARVRALTDDDRPRCARPGCTRPRTSLDTCCSTSCAVELYTMKRKARA